MAQQFSEKRVSEIVTLVFNFSNGLPPNVILTGTPNVVVKPCVRPGVNLPSILYGQAIINQNALMLNKQDTEGNITTVTVPPFCAVLQPVANGVAKVSYRLEATCGTNAPPLMLTCVGILPIIA